MFEGVTTAIITPFKNGKIDENAFEKLIDIQIENKVDGIVPCGTTGESATLSLEEHEYVIELAIKRGKNKIKIIAGTGSNSTNDAIRLTMHAKSSGADGALIITPYYNKPTQDGLYRHFKTIAENVDIPIILYNVPGRTGVNMLPETVARLSEINNIVGIKEASGDVSQISEIIRLCGDKINVISGDDALFFPILALGGKGVISVIANLIPAQIVELYRSYVNNEIEKSRNIHFQYSQLMKIMFIESNPIPVKTAASLMGLCDFEIRLPLCNMKKENYNSLVHVLKDYKLIK
ncbi:4-hydroxy-tetrahydrodipicolinate synthase [Candidatus Dependentiae bacterium]|nr:4-hydroxy-tetrahydrodipicolinate synthase [Candidatus Dependentiae bacterium]